MDDPATVEKGGGTAEGIKLLLCENPLSPLPAAVDAAVGAVPESNYYTEPYSAPLKTRIADTIGVDEEHVHVNAGSELILRQLFDRFGRQVHLLTPTYPLFPAIADAYTEPRLRPEADFAFDLSRLSIPDGTSLVGIVNPNNPNGGTFDVDPLPGLLERHPDTRFLVDGAFVDVAGESVVGLVSEYDNLVVTRTFSKAHSLAGFRVGYAVANESLAADLDANTDAYPLARPSQAAALATLDHRDEIRERVRRLRSWAADLAAELESLGVETYPSETYFFLADFAPRDAGAVADALRECGILVRPLEDPELGSGFMRVTTARPAANRRVVDALAEIL
jgi:histidinol-phosphate aminotransferase